MIQDELNSTITISINKEDLHDPVSFERYDSFQNFPVSLPCGHNLSINTYHQLRGNDMYPKCPICRKEFPAHQTLPKDVFLTSIIRQVEKTQNLMCKEHPNEPAKFMCLDENVSFCDECASEGTHDGHKKKLIRNLYSMFEQKIKSLEEYNTKIDEIERNNITSITEAIKSLVVEFTERLSDIFNEPLVEKYLLERKEINKILIRKIKEIDLASKECNFLEITDLADKQLFTLAHLDKLKINEKISKVKKDISSIINVELKKLNNEKLDEEIKESSLSELVGGEAIIKDDYDIAKYFNADTAPRLTTLKIEGSKLVSVELLSISIKRLKNLTSLELAFPETNLINDKFIEVCSNSIQVLNSLTCLKFDFSSCKLITDLGLSFIASILGNFKNLTTYSLDLWGCNLITDKGLEVFFSSLLSLENLSALHLGFGETPFITDKCASMLSLSLNPLKGLTYFSLSLYTCDNVTDEFLKTLSSTLQGLEKLTSMELNFDQCKDVKNKTLEEISKCLPKFQDLNKLLFSFNECKYIDDGGLIALAEALPKLPKLTDLALNLWSCAVTDKGVEALIKPLQHMDGLQLLEFNLDDCFNVTDIGINSIATIIPNFKNMASLSLRFWTLTVSDNSLELIAKGLQELKSLKSICLNFNECQLITDTSVERLTNSIRSLSTLIGLDLNFWKCGSMTDYGRGLLSSLKLLPNITNFKLESLAESEEDSTCSDDE